MTNKERIKAAEIRIEELQVLIEHLKIKMNLLKSIIFKFSFYLITRLTSYVIIILIRFNQSLPSAVMHI